MFIGSDSHAALIVTGLDAKPAGMAYADWIIMTEPPLAGTFSSGTDVAVLLNQPVSPAATVAVTLEPDA